MSSVGFANSYGVAKIYGRIRSFARNIEIDRRHKSIIRQQSDGCDEQTINSKAKAVCVQITRFLPKQCAIQLKKDNLKIIYIMTSSFGLSRLIRYMTVGTGFLCDFLNRNMSYLCGQNWQNMWSK